MEVTIDKLTGNPLLVEVKESILETALQAKVNQGKVAGIITTTLPSSNIISDKVYEFAGANGGTVTGGTIKDTNGSTITTLQNGDSLWYNPTTTFWYRIPFQSLVNYYTKDQTDTVIDNSLSIIFSKYYNFNGISSKYGLAKTYILKDDGDYVEMLIKPNGNYNSTNFDKLGIIGKGTNQGTFGIHPLVGLYYRDDANVGVSVGTNNVTLGSWHTLKLAIVGSNYVVTHNGLVVKTAPKLANLSFNMLGGLAYYDKYSPIDIQYLKINTSVDSLITITDFTAGITDTNVVKYYTKIIDSTSFVYPNLLYKYVLSTKTFVVYQYIGHGLYNGINIVHDIDMSELVYKNYWRVTESKLYRYDGAMTEVLITVDNILDSNGVAASVTTSNLLTSGESEFTMHVVGKYDHTGGTHGDELVIEANFFADGKLLTIISDIDLTEANEFSYIEKSSLHETTTDGINPIPGHPIIAYHFKKTVINSQELLVNNRVTFTGIYNIDYFYAGISSTSRLLTKYGYDEKMFKLYDLDTEMNSIGGSGLAEFHSNNALSVDIITRIIAGNKTPTLRIFDNAQPLLYKKYYCSISGTTSPNEEWWSETIVKIKSNLDL